jgi:isopenicillin N synthase-like dioxygenase
MPIDLIYIQPCDDNIRHGSSLSALVELANAANYTLIETTLFNAFFVTNELYEQYLMKEIPDTSIETLHEVTMGSELYQLYDGTLCLWGCKKLLWHRVPINEEKIQMLAPENRLFPFAPSIVEQQSSHQCVGKGRLKHQTQYRSSQLECFRKIRDTAVDMSSYCNDKFATIDMKRECSTKLNATLHQDGFAYVRGLGIPNNICNNALCAARSFLHEANESVRRSCLTTDRARRGYSPMSTENFASLIGEHGPNDLVKKYRIGPPMMSCDEKLESDTTLPQHPMMSSLHQPNVWPTAKSWDDAHAFNFKFAIEEYFNAICYAAKCVLRAICDEIINSNQKISIVESMKTLSELMDDDDSTGNDKKSTNHTSILTLLGYQPGSRHKKGSKAYMRPLVAAHTDVGVITILLFDNGTCAALERAANAPNNANIDDTIEWLDVSLPPLNDDNDPIFVVNVGDCLSDVSGLMLRSTLHRVLPRPCPLPSSQDTLLDDKVVRTCLALFVGLDSSALLTLPSGEVLSYEEWRRQRIARAQAVMKCNV